MVNSLSELTVHGTRYAYPAMRDMAWNAPNDSPGPSFGTLGADARAWKKERGKRGFTFCANERQFYTDHLKGYTDAFQDIDEAGGEKMSLTVKLDNKSNKVSLMRAVSASRVRKGESFGVRVGTPQHLGPGSYKGQNEWLQERPWRPKSAGSAGFVSSRPRIPVDASSWLILPQFSPDLNCGTVEDDQRVRVQSANGRPKGVIINRPHSAPAGGRG